MPDMTRTLRRTMARLGDAAARVLRLMAAPFVRMATALIGPFHLFFRHVDASHGLPMPRRAAGGGP